MEKKVIIIISVCVIIIFVVLLLFVILPFAGVPVIPGTDYGDITSPLVGELI